MVAKHVTIGITIGVFFVGIAIGYAIWANIYGPGIMFKGKSTNVIIYDAGSRIKTENDELIYEKPTATT